MQDTMRIGAAALGGYVLGRTKKAKTAITLALWLSGRGRPSDMARDQAMKALQSKKGQELLGQLRGPVMSAGRQAALGVFESQAGRLSDSLSRRTDALTAPAGEKAKKASKRSRRRPDDDEDELSARRRPSGRTPERSRRPSRSRDVEEPEDEYEDEASDEDAEYEDEYDDEYADDEEEAEGGRGRRLRRRGLRGRPRDFAPPRFLTAGDKEISNGTSEDGRPRRKPDGRPAQQSGDQAAGPGGEAPVHSRLEQADLEARRRGYRHGEQTHRHR
jgi:hypothetical protein